MSDLGISLLDLAKVVLGSLIFAAALKAEVFSDTALTVAGGLFFLLFSVAGILLILKSEKK